MANSFRFKQFEVKNGKSALKVGTDAVLLGAAMTLLPEDRTLLDIGTGTGVIALMAAQRCGAGIIGIDIDSPSAEEAAENFSLSPWAGRLRAENAALASFRPPHKFDLIFSNPPYYDNSLLNPDARESAARHTESLSYREIAAFASEWLEEEGRLSLILPFDCKPMVLRTAASFGLFPFRAINIKTTARKPFRRVILEFSRRRAECAESELVLQDGNARTAQYSELTEDFYL